MTYVPAQNIIVGEIADVSWLEAQDPTPASVKTVPLFGRVCVPAQPALPRRIGSIKLANGWWFNFPEDGSLSLDFTPRKGMVVEIEGRYPITALRLAQAFEPPIVASIKTNIRSLVLVRKTSLPWMIKTDNAVYKEIRFARGWQSDFQVTADMRLEIDIEIGVDYRTGNPCFETQSIRQAAPDFDDALHRMLIAAKVPPATLKKLEAALGSEWASIVRNDKDRLFEGAEFKRVHLSTKDKIWQTITEHAKSTATHRALLEGGLDSKLIKRADDAQFHVHKNPWRLVWERKVSFASADKLAQCASFQSIKPYEAKSVDRHAAIIAHAMNRYFDEGHAGWPLSKISDHAHSHYAVTETEFEEPLKLLENSRSFAREGGILFSRAVAEAEMWLFDYLENAAGSPLRLDSPFNLKALENLNLSIEQKAAIELTSIANVTVITGGPGTGKTTCLKALKRAYPGASIILGCVAAKAAANAHSKTGIEAMSIFRLLCKKNPKNPTPAKPDRLRDYNILIIDETSMLSSYDLVELLKIAEKAGIQKIIFVGDDHQLQPIGIGEPFRNIIEGGLCPIARLTKIFRTASDGGIAALCADIKRGEFNLDSKACGNDVEYLECGAGDILGHVLKLYTRMRGELKIARDDICILSAEKKSEDGTFAINDRIREHYGCRALTPGEPVMCIENHVADGEELILNGWTGEIVSCMPKGNMWVLTLAFPFFG